MKQLFNIKYLCSFLCSFIVLNVYAQFLPIVVNNTPVVGTCSLGAYGNAQISVPTEALSGDNILLNITFPATSVGCVKKVTVTNSANLNFVSSATPFVPAGTNIYTNAAVLDPINGQNFNVIYKFPNGITCNNASGNFSVEFEVTCGATVTKCTANVSVKARAGNYWTVSKQYITGNLVCGESSWRFLVTHSNPNPSGLGAYNISGTITETTPLPIVSGATHSVSGSCYASGSYVYVTKLKNCQNVGTTITNTANYSFSLGSGCGTMANTLSATSATLAAPSASISFTKSAYSNSWVSPNYLFFPGCKGYYVLSICNNGNVPWTNFTVTDNLSIPGINVTSISAAGWTQTPGGLTGLQTFTNTSLILNPGDCASIVIYFTVTGSISSTVTNTATLSYTGSGSSGGGGGSGCPSISCPVINTSLQNTTATNTFIISAPVAVPSIVKCNEPNPWVIPIKQVGNTIKFRIQVGNKGAANLNTTITDALTASPQNLSITGTPTYTYYPNQLGNYCGVLSGTGTVTTSMGSWNVNTTSPIFSVVNLPGNCNLNQSNILVIEFDATINPQLSGSRTNTAVMGTLSGSANYTIDKTGELKIRKVADVSTVENGVPFNYTLTVTNMGSTPLNNIIVTDVLPSCIQLLSPIVVRLGVGGPIVTHTLSGMMIITVNPTAVINPGQSFVITVPVKKLSGTTCCNPLATATAKMIPDGTLINATTPIDQPACVSSTTCCDIKNFETSLTNIFHPTITNRFNLYLNAGSIPVQEIEVSMLDYHVVYTSPLCKPADMGIFGNIFSPNTTIGGLTLSNNNSQSINWGLGTATVLNHTIRLYIGKPAILALSCCNGTMYFCLKVRIKNVDCQVCEKILCGKYSIKSGIQIWEPVKDDVIKDKFQLLQPDRKAAYEKLEAEQMQEQEIESLMIQEAVGEELKNTDANKAREFIEKMSKNPYEIIQQIKAKIYGGLLVAPTSVITPKLK